MWVKNFSPYCTINTLLMLFYGPEKKQIFGYKICMPFVWIILIKGRLTNQFFPEKHPVDVSSRPPLPLPRNVSGLKSLKIDFFRLRLGA